MYSTHDFIRKAVQELPEKALGFSTGFPDLDKITRGLRGGEITIIGGWSSMGKTALLANIAVRSAVQVPQLIFSAEMSVSSLMGRMIVDAAQVPSDHIRLGNMTEDEQNRLNVGTIKLENRPIFIEGVSQRAPKFTPQIISDVAEEFSESIAKDFVIHIDYLQLLEANSPTNNKRIDIDNIMNDLCIIAKTLNVPIVIACQLKRPDEQKYGREPRLSDLKESSGIENAAEVVLLLHRPAYFKMKEVDVSTPDDGEAFILVAKNRNGRQGKVPVIWLDSLVSFQDIGVLDESTDNLYTSPEAGRALPEAAEDAPGSTQAGFGDQTIPAEFEGTGEAAGGSGDFIDDLTPPPVDDEIPF